MTTHSVRQYVTGIQRKLDLEHIGRRLTKVQTGGPDGDLGSNEILMSPQSSEKEMILKLVERKLVNLYADDL